VHHDVVDADESSYAVSRLEEMKSRHEAQALPASSISDADAQQITQNIGAVTVAHGSVVITNNQSGGQAAHVINNYGSPKRVLSDGVRVNMLALLAGKETGSIGFASTQGDVEAHEFKLQLLAIFRQAGWSVQDLQTFMFFGSRTGLVLTIPFGAPEVGLPQVAGAALAASGQPIAGNRGDMAKGCGIYVQVWHAA
jgi:hypothetical protein